MTKKPHPEEDQRAELQCDLRELGRDLVPGMLNGRSGRRIPPCSSIIGTAELDALRDTAADLEYLLLSLWDCTPDSTLASLYETAGIDRDKTRIQSPQGIAILHAALRAQRRECEADINLRRGAE